MEISKYFFSPKAVSTHALNPWEVLSWSQENLALSLWPHFGLPASLTPPEGAGCMFPWGPTAPTFSQLEPLCPFGVAGFLDRLVVPNGFEELRKMVDVVPQKKCSAHPKALSSV